MAVSKSHILTGAGSAQPELVTQIVNIETKLRDRNYTFEFYMYVHIFYMKEKSQKATATDMT